MFHLIFKKNSQHSIKIKDLSQIVLYLQLKKVLKNVTIQLK